MRVGKTPVAALAATFTIYSIASVLPIPAAAHAFGLHRSPVDSLPTPDGAEVLVAAAMASGTSITPTGMTYSTNLVTLESQTWIAPPLSTAKFAIRASETGRK